MKKKYNRRCNFKSGFTIIEVMVAVIIISVIAAIGWINLQKAVLSARERDAIQQLRAIYQANSMYNDRARHYLGLVCSGATCVDSINSGLGLDILPNGMVYEYSNDGVSYVARVRWRIESEPGYFRLQVSLGNPEPCCDDGSCPTLPNC